MKETNENRDLSSSTERQIMLYQADKEDSIPAAMEEIKISIINERAMSLKRKKVSKRATPCSKKLRSAISCSTPHSTSSTSWSSPSTSKSKDVNQNHVSTPSYTLEQSPEWDDSLLEPSDNEDDSPLYLTVDEIESLLEDDFSFEAETFGLDDCSSSCIGTPESEDQKDKLCSSPCSQLDGSNTLTEGTLCGEDLNNYAAIGPSLSHSVIHSVEVSNEKFYDSVQETNGISVSGVPVLNKAEALTHQLARDCSADLPVQSPSSLYSLDVVVEWNDDHELSFDGDIDDLLALSPGGSTSTEEETAAETCGQITKQYRSALSDSVNSFKHSNSIPVNQTANSAGSDTADVLQQLSPSTSNLSDTLEVHHTPSTVPEPLKHSGTLLVSTVVVSDTQSNLDAAEDVKPSTSTESDAQSTVILSDQPVNSSATQTSSSQQTVIAPVSKSAASQKKSHAAVTPVPRPTVTLLPTPAHRILSQLDDDDDKQNYFRQVSMHIQGSYGANHLDPFHELTSLLNQISRHNQNWKHPSDFSKRNHHKRGKKPSTRCTLKEWEAKNGGTVQRFVNIPSSFQRNPVP